LKEDKILNFVELIKETLRTTLTHIAFWLIL